MYSAVGRRIHDLQRTFNGLVVVARHFRDNERRRIDTNAPTCYLNHLPHFDRLPR